MKIKLVFATNNENKLREVQQMLSSDIELISLKQIGCFEEIPETAQTIEENALQKAKYIKQKYGYNVFADDTGLEVQELNNEPGVFSARYAGEQKNADDNMNLLLERMKEKTNRMARFKTVFALCLNEKEYLFEGVVKGEITYQKRGINGFGYDPIFQPKGYKETFAELTSEVKNTISHRGKAVEKLVSFLKKMS